MPTFTTIQPLLAASLRPQALRETDRNPQRVSSGLKDIDDALKGGFDHGVGGLACVSGEKGVGKTGLAFAFLTTHLIKSTTNQAVLIDTTGTFDVLRLYNSILHHLRRRQPQASTDEEEVVAAEMLDRVKIMRVFDFVGMVEAVSEVREKLESQRDHFDKQPRTTQVMAEVQQQQQQTQQDSAPKLQRIRSTIPDSEDEEDEDDDVMLFDEVDGPLEEETRHEKPPQLSGIPQENQDSKTAAEDVRIGMIVIDNITHVVGPMMKTNYVQASALLTSFLRSLSHLTKSHSLSTILINAATTAPAAPPGPPTGTAHPSQHGRKHAKKPLPSIFASAAHTMPALSPLLPAHADIHLLITKQPLTRSDAITFHSSSKSSSTQASGSRLERVSVAEVLSDRYGDRSGRWAAFSADAQGSVLGVDAQRGAERKQYRLPGFASKTAL